MRVLFPKWLTGSDFSIGPTEVSVKGTGDSSYIRAMIRRSECLFEQEESNKLWLRWRWIESLMTVYNYHRKEDCIEALVC